MQICLIRHGMTEANKHYRYAGVTDVPLCDEGVAQAQAVGGNQNVKKVYVTPLIRTQQTAKLLFPNAEQIIIPQLQEMNFGDFENRSAADMENDTAYRAWVDGNCLAACPNGESRAAFSERVCDGFVRCIDAHEDREEPAVFVVHGGTIMSILERFARPAVDYYGVHTKNCEGFCCTLSPADGDSPLTLTELTAFERFPL